MKRKDQLLLVVGLSLLIVSCRALDSNDKRQPPSSTPSRAKPHGNLRLNNIFGVDLPAQTRILVQAVPSTLILLILNHILKSIKNKLQLRTIPHALVGMFAVLAGLVSMNDADAGKVVDFMKPGVELLTTFLPAFFIPALAVSPLSLSAMSGLDSFKFFGAISIAIPFVYLCTGKTVEFLQRIQGSGGDSQEGPRAAANVKFVPPFSVGLEKLLTFFVASSGILALYRPGKISHIFYAITTIYSYVFASRLPRIMPPTLARLCHPLLTSFAWSSIIFAVFGMLRGQSLFPVLREYFVPGGPPMSAAGNHVLFWLEPSIITFAFGLYARRRLLFANALPILGGALTSTVIGIFTTALLGRLFAAPKAIRLALLPRATAALAVVQAATIGANPPLTAVNCCYTGIFGANFGVMILNALRIIDPIARGVATGGGGLALAAASLSTLDPAAFPFGALGMSLTSAMATILFCIPQFANAAKAVAGI